MSPHHYTETKPKGALAFFLTLTSKPKSSYFEHLRLTTFATGESSGIQFDPAEGEFSISSISSSIEVCFPSNHLSEVSLTRPSRTSRGVLLDILTRFPHPVLSKHLQTITQKSLLLYEQWNRNWLSRPSMLFLILLSSTSTLYLEFEHRILVKWNREEEGVFSTNPPRNELTSSFRSFF